MKQIIIFHSKTDANKWLKDNRDAFIRLTPKQIVREVSHYLGVPIRDILGHCRLRNFTYARHVSIYLICTYTNKSLVDIAAIFDGRDHTSIIHSRDKIARLMKGEKVTKLVISEVCNALGIPSDKSFVTI